MIVDSLAKTMNLPGERIGFLATANKGVIDAISSVVLARRCNPPTTLGPLLLFEGLARKVRATGLICQGRSLDRIVDGIMQGKNYPFDKNSFKDMYREWNDWNIEVLQYYQDNLFLVKTILSRKLDGYSPDKAAFNTFIKLSGIEKGTNSIDFLAKLMFTTATYTQVGPCFGLSQKVWDKELGVWTRITYACSRQDLVDALTRLVAFSQFYADQNFGDPNKFPILEISYDNQV